MFTIKNSVLKNVLEKVNYHNEVTVYNATKDNITGACLEYNFSRDAIVLLTSSYNQVCKIDFPNNEEGVKLYIDLVVMKLDDKDKEKSYNDFLKTISFYKKMANFTKEYFLQKTRENFLQTQKDSMKNYVDKRFEELRAKMPENIKNIELNNDWFGPRTAKVMLSKPIIIPRTKGDSGKLGKTLGNIVWDEFKYELYDIEKETHATDALHYFVETELEKIKKEKNNMNKKAFLTGDFFPLSPKAICLVAGSRGGGKQFETAKLYGQEKLVQPKKPRPDSIMIDEEHRIVVAFLNGKRYVAECQDGDKFDFRVGIGNIVSKCNDSNVELKYLRKKMKWNEYYLYCYNKFFYFNQERIKAFENSVLAEKEQYRLRFNEEKVKAYKAELNGEKYRMKKVCHNFIVI